VVAGGFPDAHLHLVGSGPLRGELEALAADLGLESRVAFHGSVPHDELPPYYRAADLHVLSSRFESQGMAVLEAAACGTGTVGTAMGVLRDLGPAARTVPAGEPDALARSILDVLEHPDGAADLGRAAREAVLDDYTLDRCVSRLEAIYASLTKNG
jgi:glycosyltransferase involved in cell wall biosynthesis